jgi:hypothetical protein
VYLVELIIVPKSEAKRLSQLLQDGCGVVNSDYKSIPLNWGGKIGEMFARNWRDAGPSYRPWLSKAMNMTEDEFNTEWEAAIEECKTGGIYCDLYWACGQVPDIAVEKQ